MSQTIGQQLKQIREMQDKSLEEISQKTHIRLAYLEAIEANDIDSLPSNTHLRGFVRLYASELGIEIEDLQVKDIKPGKEQEKSVQTNDHEEIRSSQADTIDQLSSRDDSEDMPELLTSSKKDPVKQREIINEVQAASGTSIPQKTSEIFKVIGEKLRTRRELLSLSFDDIQKNIHVRKEYLTLIEAGRFGSLPSPVQAKGMLQNYAEFLNLDVDSLLLDFADGLQLQRLEKQRLPGKQNRSAREISSTALQLKNFFSLDLLVILTLFIVFAIFVIWGVNRILDIDSPDTAATEIPGVSDVLLAPVSPTPDLTMTPNDIEPVEISENAIQEDEPPLFDPIISNDPINVIVIPRQRVWVQVLSDSEMVFEGRLIPGNVYDYSGQEMVEILVANAGAVQIFYNDQDLGSPGLFGQVASLSFTTSGLVQPTPTITPTVTETPETTPTPSETPTPTPADNNDQTD